MSTSFPSKPVVGIDVPEVRRFRAQFHYNFFTTDERLNEEGTVPPQISRRKNTSFDSEFIDEIEKIVPRFVSFSFRPVKLQFFAKRSPFIQASVSVNRRGLIRRNLDRIHGEDEFANASFTGIEFQDTGIDGKFYLLMSGSLAKRINSKNLETARAINDEIGKIGTAIDSEKVSLLDVSKFLNNETDVEIPDKLIIKSLNRLQSLGARFLDDEQTQEKIDETFERIKRVKTRIRINNKIINSALQTSANDPVGIFADEIGPMLEKAANIQDNEVAASAPTEVDAADFDIVVDAIHQQAIPHNTIFSPTKRIIGYIIDKFEVLDDGTLEPQTPIILEEPNVNSAVDFKVAYGTTYVYQIRAIAEVVFATTDPDTEELVASTVLISSSPSQRVCVECVEEVPPPPPADFDVSWETRERAARLMWSFPVNPQRDIKRFQIFRRRTTMEPFQLVKEFDFDDSDVKTPGFENPNINLIERMNSPRTFWLDREFTKDSKFIYTLCSIDAHGLSSNYGMQFEISFDRFKNKLIKKLVSNSGAPKPYPNMYLREDTFADVIKDSGHSRVRIYFDPEYLSVCHGRSSDRDLGLLATDQTNGKYQLQFINLDLQKRQGIDILLRDKRTTDNKSQSPNKTVFKKPFKIKKGP